MDAKLTSIGYEFEPSRYSPGLGYSRLRVVISGKPTQRFFDVKLLRIPTFDGRFLRQTQVTRHELEPNETFQVCLGELRLETLPGRTPAGFLLWRQPAAQQSTWVICIASLHPMPQFLRCKMTLVRRAGLIADEIMDLLAEKKITIAWS